jgi:hypothetical protein
VLERDGKEVPDLEDRSVEDATLAAVPLNANTQPNPRGLVAYALHQTIADQATVAG